MIHKLFQKKRKKRSIYRIWISGKNDKEQNDFGFGDGAWEYEYLLNGEKPFFEDTHQLNDAVDQFYFQNQDSLKAVEEFFKAHRALKSEASFLSHLLQKIEFEEDRLVGLSILLMRDGEEVETVKFGMLLTKYYNLSAVPRALEILIQLCYHPAFVYYGLDVLKMIDYGILDEIHQKSFGFGKKIIEEKIWK